MTQFFPGRPHRPLRMEALEDRDVPALHPGVPQFFDIPAHASYAVPAGAVYVAPNGNPGVSGTNINAPTTLANALATAPTGGTVVLRGGTYQNVGALTVSRRLTLQAYAQERPWLNGAAVVTNWQFDAAAGRWYMATRNYDPDGAGPAPAVANFEFRDVDPDALDPAHPLADNLEMVFVDGRALEQVGSLAELTADRFFVDYAAQRLYLGGDPAGRTVEVAARAWGLDVAADGSVVRGLGFTHYANRGLYPSGNSATFESNAFTWNGYSGAGRNNLQSRYGGGDGLGESHTWRGNLFAGNGYTGYSGNVGRYFRVEGNTFSYNNVENFSKTYGAAGIKVVRVRDGVFVNNVFEHNNAKGLWLDINCIDTDVVGNVSRYNGHHGIFYEISQRGLIAFNVSHDNAQSGVSVWNSHSTRVYNNTLVGNYPNLTMGDTTRNNTVQAEIDQGHTWIARDNVALNNILANPQPTGQFGGYSANQFNATNAGTGLVSADMFTSIDHNAYYRVSPSGTTRVRWNRLAGNDPNGSPDTAYQTFGAFRTDYPQYEANGFAIDGEPARTFFVDEAGRDLRLRAGSEAIGRAGAIPAADAARIRAAGFVLPADNPGYLGALAPAAGGNRPPVLAAIADRTIPNSQDLVTVTLSATDPDGDAVTYTATAQSAAFVLDGQLGFYTDGNLYQNFGGRNEKWFLATGGVWHFIVPDGRVYRWNGAAGADGAVVGSVGALYHARPELLFNAREAAALDTSLGLTFAGDLYENFGGRGERWLLGNGNVWHFVLPSGELYRWNGGAGANGTLVGTPGAGFHQYVRLLYEADRGQAPAVLSVSGSTLTIDRDDGLAANLVVGVTASDGRGGTDTKTFALTVV